MYILAIETTGPVGSVAVIDADGADRKQSEDKALYSAGAAHADEHVPVKITTQTMSHLKNLIPIAAELLEEEKICRDEICAVAASIGPGSFTGIRIGVSTARALAQAWNVPCISVPTLELFRQKCGENEKRSVEPEKNITDSTDSGNAAGHGDGSVCVIFNARRGQVYGACYSGTGEALIEPGPYMLADMLDRIEELRIKPLFYGDGVDAYFDKEEFIGRVSDFDAAPEAGRYQTADMTARYAREVWKAACADEGSEADAEGQISAGRIVQYEELLPDYMRESEAEQRLKDGSLEKMRRAKMEKFMKMAGKQA